LNKAFTHTIFRICLILIPAFTAMNLSAQIFSPAANAVRTTQYPVDTVDSPVFIFFSPPNITVQGSLVASFNSPETNNFDWFQYNTLTGGFDVPMLSQTSVSESHLDNLPGGGYRVHVWNGTDTDTTFTAWLHIDKLHTSIVKDTEGNLMKSAYTCDYLTLSGTVSIDTFFYYDPISKSPVRLRNGFTFLWTSDNAELSIPNKDRILDPNTTYSPPYLDTWYILTARDSFGMTDIDSVFYESIQVKPDFSFELFEYEYNSNDNTYAGDFTESMPPAEGDALLKVRFKNESKNGFSYEWIFSDSVKSDLFANELTSDLAYEPEYVYKIPNDYYPAIVATSEAGCVDTFKLEEPITVIPSLLEIPNVFSPDKDGLNDYFRVNFKSIKEFSIRIFDRTGKMVYKAEVSDMYTWEGWNGNVMDSDRGASPGLYYYVIDATGWDKEHYHKGQYRGVVYLFRSKE